MTTLTTTISGAYQVTEITVTTPTYTVANIAYPLYGQTLVVIIKNASGGAITITWGAGYTVDSWVNPATGFSRGITFYADLASGLYLQIGDYATSSSANLTGPVTSVGSATTIVGPIDNVTIGGSVAAVGSFTQTNVSTKILVGGPTSAVSAIGVQVYGDSSTLAPGVIARGYSNTAAGPNFLLVKTRGTTSTSNTAVQLYDSLGGMLFGGADGTSNQLLANISAFVDGAVSTGTVPIALSFATGTNNSTLPRQATKWLSPALS